MFANKKALELFGLTDWKDRNIKEFFTTPEARAELERRMAARKEGFSEEYQIEMVRQSDQRRLSVAVAAMPVFATNSGNEVISAIAILRSLEAEQATEHMNRAVDKALTSRDTLVNAADELKKVIPFNLFFASAYNEAMTDVLLLLEYPESLIQEYQRNFEISPTQKGLTFDFGCSRRDLRELYLQSEAPTIKVLLDRGLRYMMRFPVASEGRLVGGISILRTGDEEFSDRELALFRDLPLAKALISSLRLKQQEENDFRLELIKEITLHNRDKEMFKLLVDKISQHYKCSFVSVFLVDDIKRQLILQSQSWSADQSALPEDFEMSADKGIMGHVWKTDVDANVGDVAAEPYKSIVVHAPGRKGLVSELVMRILSRGRTYALLNIEDSRINAFTGEEVRSLRALLDEIGTIIDRRMSDNLASAVLNATPTAVLVVDDQGVIRQANPSAAEFLGYSALDLVGKPLTTYVDEVAYNEILEKRGDQTSRMNVGSRAGTKRALVAVTPLEMQLKRKMVTLRDISYLEHAEMLEGLRTLYSNVAQQVKTPLLLAALAVQEIRDYKPSSFGLFRGRPAQDSLFQAAEDILRQLQRANLAYDELQLIANKDPAILYHPIPLELGRLIASALDEMPESLLERIERPRPAIEIHIFGDAYQLVFVVQTALLQLLRLSPGQEKVVIRLIEAERRVKVEFESCLAPQKESDSASNKDTIDSARAFADLEMRFPMLSRFIANNQGEFPKPEFTNGKILLRFDMPKIVR